MGKISDFNSSNVLEMVDWPAEDGTVPFRFRQMRRQELLENLFAATLGLNDVVGNVRGDEQKFTILVRDLLANAFQHLAMDDELLRRETVQ
jgi:hypothetical protein